MKGCALDSEDSNKEYERHRQTDRWTDTETQRERDIERVRERD